MRLAIDPAGIAPAKAPNVMREPTQEPSSELNCRCEWSLWSSGKAGLVHDKHVPAENAPRVAEKGKFNYLGLICI